MCGKERNREWGIIIVERRKIKVGDIGKEYIGERDHNKIITKFLYTCSNVYVIVVPWISRVLQYWICTTKGMQFYVFPEGAACTMNTY